jgi:hypothetical protein
VYCAGLLADFARAIREIETEFARRFGARPTPTGE